MLHVCFSQQLLFEAQTINMSSWQKKDDRVCVSGEVDEAIHQSLVQLESLFLNRSEKAGSWTMSLQQQHLLQRFQSTSSQLLLYGRWFPAWRCVAEHVVEGLGGHLTSSLQLTHHMHCFNLLWSGLALQLQHFHLKPDTRDNRLNLQLFSDNCLMLFKA